MCSSVFVFASLTLGRRARDCDRDVLVVGGGLGVVFLPLFAADLTGVFLPTPVSAVVCFSASFDGLPRIRAIFQKGD